MYGNFDHYYYNSNPEFVLPSCPSCMGYLEFDICAKYRTVAVCTECGERFAVSDVLSACEGCDVFSRMDTDGSELCELCENTYDGIPSEVG